MKTYAQIAYEAYRNHTGGKSLATGQDIPEWADLAHVIQEAWSAAATEVAVECCLRMQQWSESIKELEEQRRTA